MVGFSSLIAQESQESENQEGKDYRKLKHAWSAQWITHPTAPTMEYGVFLFRRMFSLNQRSPRWRVHISADNRYRLYVNGQRVCTGPSVGDLGHHRYESIDIAPFLKEGQNVIGAEVVNFGEYRRAAQQSFQTAFILQADSLIDAGMNTGSSGWKVMRSEAHRSIPFTSDSLQSYYAAGPGDRVDMALYPWGWLDEGFDDSAWLVPKRATVEFAVGRGFLYGSTWFLVPRPIPFLEETAEPFRRIARSEGITVGAGFLAGAQPLTIPARSTVSILIDQSYHTTGFPEMTISGGKGSTIKVTYAEALLLPASYLGPQGDGNLLFADLKGDRNSIAGKAIHGYYDIVLPDGGMHRFFKPLSRRTYRFIQLDIQTSVDSLQIERYHGIYTAYPYSSGARVTTGRSALDSIWDVAWRTFRNSSEESFSDPYYEQLQYIGDTRIASLISLTTSDDDRLVRQALVQFDESRLSEGLTQSRYPSSIVQVIPTYSLLWIQMVHDFAMYRDDPPFVRSMLPGIRNVLEWFVARVDTTGMLGELSWWNFTDWARGFPNGIPPGADNGHSANVSLQFVSALQKAHDLFKMAGWTHDARRYGDLAQRVRRAVVDHCFDNTRGLLAETPAKRHFSQHTNIFAILTDAVPRQCQQPLMDSLLRDTSLTQATVYFRFYLFRALQKAGLGDRYLNMLGPWTRMLEQGMTTFGETDVNPRSDCHVWSASPCFDFLAVVAGIEPDEPGFKTVRIEPSFGYLDSLHADMPHPRGRIRMSLRKGRAGGVTGTISLPENVKARFVWKGKDQLLTGGVQRISW
jgi:hypothetical protein